MIYKSTELNKIVSYKNIDYIFISFAAVAGDFQNILTKTLHIATNIRKVVVETFLLNRILLSFKSRVVVPLTSNLPTYNSSSSFSLLLPNTDPLQQFEDYVRGCLTLQLRKG